MFELSQSFYFESAHTLQREVGAAESTSSRRVHGHTYTARVTVRGEPDPATGMVVDLSHLRDAIATVREQLDHHLLNEVPGLGMPTLEGLCAYVHRQIVTAVPQVAEVSVERKSSGDRCTYRP
jgi:6-pyruvoyltetrahydropterin/6-carboxytetrahydropterin synthase